LRNSKPDMDIDHYLKGQMLEIPGGGIKLRDDRTKQEWTVELKPFWLSKFPVTQDLYHAVTQASPSTFVGNRLPVETITWKECVTFCYSLSQKSGLKPCYLFQSDKEDITFDPTADGFRLPTEAEWEYACKAGTTA
jgi:formylglycine-generating enzyme required for sulfatase activity